MKITLATLDGNVDIDLDSDTRYQVLKDELSRTFAEGTFESALYRARKRVLIFLLDKYTLRYPTIGSLSEAAQLAASWRSLKPDVLSVEAAYLLRCHDYGMGIVKNLHGKTLTEISSYDPELDTGWPV